MRIPSGVVDQYIYFIAVDATDLKTRETGLITFTVYRSRNGAAAAMTTPTVTEVSAANMPGVYKLLLNANITTLTISNPSPTGNACSFTLVFTADGTARTVTWGASVKWSGGTAPTLTSTNAKKDFFTFYTSDAGTNWYGFTAGQNF